MKLRSGGSLEKTVYLQVGDEPSKSDPLICTGDTAEKARRLIALFNEMIYESWRNPGDTLAWSEDELLAWAVTYPPGDQTGDKTEKTSG